MRAKTMSYPALAPTQKSPIPITIVTGFLGSGKTTLILNLAGQLPDGYRLAVIKNEFGDTEVDSALLRQQELTNRASEAAGQRAPGASIADIREMANGCVCCNLVGQLSEALEELRTESNPDRIVVETSGSALPATLVLEINRMLSTEPRGRFVLDGVVSVIDCENWKGYQDTSATAKIQARLTDLVVLNKWEDLPERQVDDCIDKVHALDPDTPITRSDMGSVSRDLLLGLDPKLSKDSQFFKLPGYSAEADEFNFDGDHHSHNDEVDVVSVAVRAAHTDYAEGDGLDLVPFERLLTEAPREDVYRIKAIVRTRQVPSLAESGRLAKAGGAHPRTADLRTYALNWAFGRWRYTFLEQQPESEPGKGSSGGGSGGGAAEEDIDRVEPLVRMTIVTAPGDGRRWRKKVEEHDYLTVASNADGWEIVVTGHMQ